MLCITLAGQRRSNPTGCDIKKKEKKKLKTTNIWLFKKKIE